MTIPDRSEIVRIDCAACNGNGYKSVGGAEEPCATCGGVGMREKKMPWKPEGYSHAEICNIFGVRDFSNRGEVDNS